MKQAFEDSETEVTTRKEKSDKQECEAIFHSQSYRFQLSFGKLAESDTRKCLPPTTKSPANKSSILVSRNSYLHAIFVTSIPLVPYTVKPEHRSDYCENEKACQLKVYRKMFLGRRRSGFPHTHTHTRVRQPERKSGWLLFHIFLDTFSVGNSTRLSYTIRDQRPRGICIEDVFFPIFPLTCRKQYQLFSTGDNQRNRFPCANYFLWEASSGISRVVVNYRFIGEPRETMFLQK